MKKTMSKQSLKVILANPRGFCAGVERAIIILEKALEKFSAPIYVHHEIVHNKYIVENFKAKGAIFIEDINEVPTGATVIFSAHGVSKFVEDSAKKLNLIAIDATCPLVKKVHIEAQRHEKNNRDIILIGHEGHAEVVGTSGQVEKAVYLVQNPTDAKTIEVQNPNNLAYVTQTTLSVDETKEIIAILKERFPNIIGPNSEDICYATQNRQDAVRELAKNADKILVVGSKNSSNSNRLRDLAMQNGTKALLIDSHQDINASWLKDVDSLGITAGASAPEILIEQILDFLRENFTLNISSLTGVEENIKFKLPKIVM